MPVGPYFADFLCRSHSLVIELDGHSHDIAPLRDHRRDKALIQIGFRVLHFTNTEVLDNVQGVIACIRGALAEATR